MNELITNPGTWSFMTLFFLYGLLTAKELKTQQLTTPQSFLLKEAELQDNKLFVLGKNNNLYSFNIHEKAIAEKNEKHNIKGLFKDSTGVYAWNDHELYIYNMKLNDWKLIRSFNERYIKGIVSVNNDVKVIFYDGLLSIMNHTFRKSPYPIMETISGSSYIICTNKFLYRINNENVFVKITRMDSAAFMKDIFSLNDHIFYLINNNLKVVDTELLTTTGLILPDSVTNIIGFYKQHLFYKNSKGIAAFNPLNKETSQILSSDVFNVQLLDNGNLLYNDAAGKCLYYQSASQITIKVGEGIKSYRIIDLLEDKNQSTIITSEGFIFYQKNKSIESFIDLHAVSGKMYGAVQNNSELYVACEMGLLTFSLNTSEYYLNKELKGIECNSIVLADKYLYISSSMNGVFKIKPGTISGREPKVCAINEGLLVSSTYLIKNYGGVLYTVSNSGIYRKSTKGDKWIEYHGSGFIKRITGVAHFKKHCDALLIASVERGVMKTNDEGKTYESMNLGLIDSSIISMEADSSGFYVLTKSGDIYFHPHDGIEWTKINKGMNIFNSVFLHSGLLYLVDADNNINLLETDDFKPGMHSDWDIKPTYFHGDKIRITYRFTGLTGKSNHAVLQIASINESFNKASVLVHSNLREASMECAIPDTLAPGIYQIRLVGTDPFVRSVNAVATIEVKQKLPALVPPIIKAENVVIPEIIQVAGIK
ncbi:MAG: hypothetical protein Q8M15_12760 [Bacteroidota bacterium]|nr:hypothetical protein [Bacteroidota bacterium]